MLTLLTIRLLYLTFFLHFTNTHMYKSRELCVCVRESERERETVYVRVCVQVSLCVCVRVKERELFACVFFVNVCI